MPAQEDSHQAGQRAQKPQQTLQELPLQGEPKRMNIVVRLQFSNISALILQVTYFLGHKNDETILLDGVLRELLRIIVHDFTIGNQLLGLSRMAVSLHDLLLQNCDLGEKMTKTSIMLELSRAGVARLLTVMSSSTSRGNC